MAYGLRCAKCGHQETNHEIGPNDEKHLRGYRYSLENCPGFSYKKEDEKDAVSEYLGELIGGYSICESFPHRLRHRAKKLEEKYWRDLGYPDGRPRRSDMVLLLTPSGVIDIGS